MYSETLFAKYSLKVNSRRKTFKIFLLLLIIVPISNLYPQYFIGQGTIDSLRLNNQKNYLTPKSEYKDKNIYLGQMDSHGYYLDVKIGFDKEVYKNGEPVMLTLNRGNENNEERVRIIITGSCKIPENMR